MQLVDSKERQTVKVWEVEEAIAQEQVEQTRKRQRRTVITDQGLTSSSEVAVTEIPYQDQVTMAVPSSSSLHFYFFIGSNGTILRIGSLYSLDFCKGSVFICTSISRNKDLFKFKFLLCSVVDKKVESIDRGVSCTVNNVAHVSCQSDVIIGSKGKGLVDKVIKCCKFFLPVGPQKELLGQSNTSRCLLGYFTHCHSSCAAYSPWHI